MCQKIVKKKKCKKQTNKKALNLFNHKNRQINQLWLPNAGNKHPQKTKTKNKINK